MPVVWLHGKKQQCRLAAVGFLFILAHVSMIPLHDNNDLTIASRSSTVFMKELVNHTASKQQQGQRRPADVPHNKNLHDNDLNNVSNSSTVSVSMTELVNLTDSKKEQQEPSLVPHNNSTPLTASIALQMPLPPTVKIHRLSTNLKSCPSTIVTGYFKLRSKHTSCEYLMWMKNMLSIQDCMVVMTESSMVGTIKSLRQHALDGTVIIEMMNSVYDLPISQLHTEQRNPEFWPHQLAIDQEKHLHQSYQVFWIWLSKTWCVVQAIHKDYFHSSWYMWQDIGSYRTQEVSAT
jgi:hypothetical protein